MTLPDLPARRKPPSRWWLYGPYIALVVAAVLWSGAWFWIRGQVAARLDAARHAAAGGPSLTWERARISGYPFRIEVVLDEVRAAEPSGWGVAAAQIRAESYAYDLKHWIGYAPQGVTLSRPGAGDVAIAGQALRASVVNDGPGQTRVSVEGLKLTFQPEAGARPFPLVAADQLDAHTRQAGQAGQVEFLIQLQGARLAPTSALGRLAAGQPVSSAWHGTLSKASAMTGRDWPQMARAWTAAGGSIELTNGWISAGPVNLDTTGGRLAIGADGRLRGEVSLGLPRASEGLAAFARAGGLDPTLARAGGQIAQARAATSPAAKADLTFEAGVATFGPIALGSAPRIY
ncbi:MAG: DUF2125 domain-containing protein [Caulobacteraceae bacterium]|nr:DUF2125 domain-containing protein [Caulobacteraceae bacterium]